MSEIESGISNSRKQWLEPEYFHILLNQTKANCGKTNQDGVFEFYLFNVFLNEVCFKSELTRQFSSTLLGKRRKLEFFLQKM